MSDVWNFYATQEHEMPGVVFVDLGLKAEAPIEGLEDVLRLEIEVVQVRANGMPTTEELERLSALEDHLLATLTDKTTLFVGRKTVAGGRDFYFYTNNAVQAEQRVGQAMVGFSEFAHYVTTKTDPEWQAYQYLLPTPRETQTIRNRDVLSALSAQGDALETPRKVTHWAYFTTSDQRANFVEALEGTPFAPAHETETIAGRDFPYGQVVEHVGPADIDSIDDAVLQLYDIVVEHGGDYDGWETVIMATEAESPNDN